MVVSFLWPLEIDAARRPEAVTVVSAPCRCDPRPLGTRISRIRTLADFRSVSAKSNSEIHVHNGSFQIHRIWRPAIRPDKGNDCVDFKVTGSTLWTVSTLAGFSPTKTTPTKRIAPCATRLLILVTVDWTTSNYTARAKNILNCTASTGSVSAWKCRNSRPSRTSSSPTTWTPPTVRTAWVFFALFFFLSPLPVSLSHSGHVHALKTWFSHTPNRIFLSIILSACPVQFSAHCHKSPIRLRISHETYGRRPLLSIRPDLTFGRHESVAGLVFIYGAVGPALVKGHVHQVLLTPVCTCECVYVRREHWATVRVCVWEWVVSFTFSMRNNTGAMWMEK